MSPPIRSWLPGAARRLLGRRRKPTADDLLLRIVGASQGSARRIVNLAEFLEIFDGQIDRARGLLRNLII